MDVHGVSLVVDRRIISPRIVNFPSRNRKRFAVQSEVVWVTAGTGSREFVIPVPLGFGGISRV